MKKTIIASLVLAGFSMTALAAFSIDSPPTITESELAASKSVPPKPAPTTAENQAKQAKQLTQEEIEKARKDLEAAKVRSRNPELWEKTKIEETVDNHNVVTEIKVTPGSTQIPYTMTRVPPSNQTKGTGAGDGTMSVPKFINFGF